MWCQSLLDELA